MLFGESKPAGERVLFDNDTAAKFVVPRTLLPWSVIYSEATGMWVATVNTNQKALEVSRRAGSTGVNSRKLLVIFVC